MDSTAVLDSTERTTISEIESHEVLMWQRCVEAAAAVPGNPLGAVIDRVGDIPMTAMMAIDSDEFNRIVGLGVRRPADREAIDTIFDFYAGLGQSQFRVEVAPVALPAELPQWLEEAGLHRVPVTVTKLWETLTDTSPAVDDPGGIEVRRLDASDRDAVARLTALAYGAFDSAVALEPWFGATVGWPGFIYYGAFDNGRLVASGAVFVEAGLAWFGMAVTHPRFRSRNIQQGLTARRLADARAQGCRLVHGEVRTDRFRSARGQLFTMTYEKPSFSLAEAS
jgi:GNAT superfamily N-acetyltransferase